MLEQISNAIKFYAFYTNAGEGATGLTVTVDVYNPAGTEVVSAGSATPLGDGIYYYSLASGSTGNEGEYIAIFKTSGTVDQKHIPALWVLGKAGIEHLDADVADCATGTALQTVDDNIDSIKADIADFRADVTGLSTFDPATDTVIVGNPNDCKADVSGLATSAEIAALNDISAADVWSAATRTLTDKADFALTTAEKTAIATAVWSAVTRTLTDPNSYKADISALATEATVNLVKTVTDKLNGLIENVSGNRFTAKALETAPDSTADITGIETDLDTLLARNTEARLAKLDVTGTLANTANADLFKADTVSVDLSGIALETSVQAVKAKTDNLPADPASETNATANKQAVLDAVNGVGADVVNIYNTTENINNVTENISNVTNILAAGSGTEKLTVTLYHDGTENPITGASVSVYYSDTLQASGISGMDGKIEFGLNAGGPYEVRINAPVLSFPITTVDVVSGTVEIVIYGAVISLSALPSVEDCLIYEPLTGYNTETDAVHTAGYANIITPYSYAGRLYEGVKVPGVWNDIKKRLEWVMPRGAIVEFTIDWHGVKRHKIKIPNAGFARLYDVKPWKGK